MKRARFSEEQIIGVLKEAEAGAKVSELCRRHGISDATFYTWRSKYGGLEVSEMRRLRQLEEENRRLKSSTSSAATLPHGVTGRDSDDVRLRFDPIVTVPTRAQKKFVFHEVPRKPNAVPLRHVAFGKQRVRRL